MNSKIQTIKKIIKEDENTDGDYWIHCGNELIYTILDTFSDDEWIQLKKDLVNFYDSEHSIFSRAILHYDTHRQVENVDIYEIFFTEFVLLNDIDDADCLLQDIMYLEKIKKPKFSLLEDIKQKIDIIAKYEKTINNAEMFEYAKRTVDNEIIKHYS